MCSSVARLLCQHSQRDSVTDRQILTHRMAGINTDSYDYIKRKEGGRELIFSYRKRNYDQPRFPHRVLFYE